MRKNLSIIFASILLLSSAATFSACDTLKDKLFKAFSTGGGDIEFTVPIITSTGRVDTVAQEVFYLNIDSVIKAETGGAFTLDIIDKVSVESAEVVINNPDADNNIANFDFGTLIFSTYNNATSDWNQAMIVASGDIPDAYAERFNLIVRDDVNLKDYLRSTKITYAYAARARRVTTKPIDGVVKVRLHIE